MRLSFYFSKAIEYSFYALFFLIPLVLSNNTSELFELNKMWLTWMLTLVVTASWIGKMILNKQLTIQRTPLDIPILLFVFFQFVSTIISQDSYVSFWGYYSRFNGGLLSTISYMLLYYAFVSNYKDILELSLKKSQDLWVKLGVLLSGLIVIFLGARLASPATQTDSGTPLIFYLSLFVAFWFGVYALRSDFLKRLLTMAIFSGVIVALWGIPSHFGSDPTCLLFRGTFDVSCWTEAFHPPSRIFSTLGQPAWLAAYMSFLIPVVIGYSLRFIKLPHVSVLKLFTTRHIIYYFIAVLFYTALSYSNTRAGFIGFWIGYLAFFTGFFLLFLPKWKTAFSLFLVYTLSFSVLTFFQGVPIPQLQQFTYQGLSSNAIPSVHAQTVESPQEQTASQTQPGNQITDSGEIRLNVWEGAIAAWKANPLFGTGVETFAFAYYKHKPVEQNLTSEWDFLYNKAHNEYLNYLTTTGIFGLGSYLLLIVWFFTQSVIKFIYEKWFLHVSSYEGKHIILSERILIFALIGGYVSILVTNFFGFSVVIINLFFFITPGMVYILSKQIIPANVFSLPRKSQELSESPSGVQYAVITFVFLMAFILNLILLRYWNADTAYALGANLNRQGQYLESYKLLQNAVTLRPHEPTFQDELAYTNAAIAGAYLLQEDATQAAQFLSTATNLSNSVVTNHPNNVTFWKNRVRMYYLLSQVDPQFLPLALESIKHADTLAPNDAKILYNHGVILGQMGRVDEAIPVLKKTIDVKPDFRDARFALALFYRDNAINGIEDGPVINQEDQTKAEEQLNYILKNINSQDEQAKETLDSWK